MPAQEVSSRPTMGTSWKGTYSAVKPLLFTTFTSAPAPTSRVRTSRLPDEAAVDESLLAAVPRVLSFRYRSFQ